MNIVRSARSCNMTAMNAKLEKAVHSKEVNCVDNMKTACF